MFAIHALAAWPAGGVAVADLGSLGDIQRNCTYVTSSHETDHQSMKVEVADNSSGRRDNETAECSAGWTAIVRNDGHGWLLIAFAAYSRAEDRLKELEDIPQAGFSRAITSE